MRIILLQSIADDVYPNAPLGLAYLGAVLEQRGCEVKIIDGAAPYSNYTISDLVNEVRDFEPHLIGISMTSYFLKYSYPLLAALLDAKLNVPIVVGGPHATLFPEEVLEYGADIAVRFDGEATILDLLSSLQGEKLLKDVKGIVYKSEDGKAIRNPGRPLNRNLDALPFPAKHLFVQKDYIKNSRDLDRFGNILSSRGCMGKCIYCSRLVRGNKVRLRSARNTYNEIVFLIEKYGIKKIRFIDDIFTVNKKRVHELCDLFLENDLMISWVVITRVDLVNEELLRHMREAGCRTISYGVENGNPLTLKRIGKGFTVDKAEEIIKVTHRVGINCSVNFMWGFPWETVKDIQTSANFVKKIMPYVGVISPGGCLIPHPGTDLYDEFKDEYGFDGWWLKSVDCDPMKGQKASPPLFAELYADTCILDKNLFNYSKKVTKEIKRAMNGIGKHNMWIASQRVKERLLVPRLIAYPLLLSICKLSEFLYHIHKKTEKLLMGPFLRIAKTFQHLN